MDGTTIVGGSEEESYRRGSLAVGDSDSSKGGIRSSAVFDWVEASMSSPGGPGAAWEALGERRYSSLDKPVKLLEQMSTFVRSTALVLLEVSTTFLLVVSSGPTNRTEK